MAVHSIHIHGSAKGKVVSYKQKNSGGWKRSRSEMAVFAGGNIYNINCNFNFNFSSRKPFSGFSNRKELKVKYETWAAGGQAIYRTKPGEVTATFELKNGYSASIALD